MIDRAKTTTAFAISILAFTAVQAAAAPLTPAEKCEVGKLKTVATYSSCLLKAEAKGLAKQITPDFSKCESKILAKFPKYENSAGPGMCPSEGDVIDIRDRTDDFETQIAVLLAGGTLPPPVCGNGTVELSEDCDIGNLDGESCSTQGFYNGTLGCDPSCVFDTTSCNPNRFEVVGATVVDHGTGLQWETKDASDGIANLANPHDVDNGYTYAVGCSNTTQSGTAYSDFLTKLNGVVDVGTVTTSGCFENHCDWRVPTVDELKSITVFSPGCGAAPCIQDAAFTPTRSGGYWTNSSRNSFPTGAYIVNFSTGAPSANPKTDTYFVRAVRTGS